MNPFASVRTVLRECVFRSARLPTLIACFASVTGARADQLKFNFGARIYGGNFYDVFHEPGSGELPRVNGYFVVDDGLQDINPGPDVAEYSAPAFMYVDGPMGALMGYGFFKLKFSDDDSEVGVIEKTGLWGFGLDYSDSIYPPHSLEELMAYSFGMMEGGFWWGGLEGAADDSGYLNFGGRVPDATGVLSLGFAVALLATVRRRAQPMRAR